MSENILQRVGDAISNFGHMAFDDIRIMATGIVTGVEYADHELEKGLNGLAAQMPAIDTAIQNVNTMFKTIAAANPGFAQNSIVTGVISDVNLVADGLNAFANAANSGTNKAVAVAQGVAAVLQAQAAAHAAQAAMLQVAQQPANTAPAPAAAPAAGN